MTKTLTEFEKIPTSWRIATFEEVAELKHGYQFRTPDFTESGIKVFKITQIKSNGTIDISNCDFIASERVRDFERVILKRGDILMALTGATIGKIARYDEDVTALQNYRVGNFIPLDDKALSKDYFYYFLSSNYFFSQVLARQTQSAQQNIGKEEINKMQIILPPIDQQITIANTLNSLDRKIKNNTQTNQTLVSIAQAIFKSWFVDFEPVKAKITALEAGGTQEASELAAMCVISGKDEAHLSQLKMQDSDAYQQLAQTAALFPAAMQGSELGDIPKGWRIGSIGEIAKARGGFAFKSNDFTTEGNEVVKIKNITGDGRVDLDNCDFISNEVASKNYKFKLSDGDLLMAMTGATVGKVGIVATSGKSAYVNQRVAKFESVEFGKKISWFLYPCIQRQIVFDSIVGTAQGSAQPNISSSGIESTEIVLPTSALINHYCDKLDPYFKKWISHNMESRLLAQLRDAVLPKLLSGEVVLDAEQA